MINRKSKKQKAIDNERTSQHIKTQLEELFAHEFKMGFTFEDDIQHSRLTLRDVFQKFCACEFDSEQHTKAIVGGRKKYNGSGMPDLNSEELCKLHFEREILKRGELDGINYRAVQLDRVLTGKLSGKPCDMYFIFLATRFGRSLDSFGCWVVKDYPQDRDFYHRYCSEKRLASVRRFKCDK